jgi:CubicO group peptidase (beta-lactamase class C family)
MLRLLDDFHYAQAFGDVSNDVPMSQDALFPIQCCEPLILAVLTLQSVERGLVGLDDDVRPILGQRALEYERILDEEEKHKWQFGMFAGRNLAIGKRKRTPSDEQIPITLR